MRYRLVVRSMVDVYNRGVCARSTGAYFACRTQISIHALHTYNPHRGKSATYHFILLLLVSALLIERYEERAHVSLPTEQGRDEQG